MVKPAHHVSVRRRLGCLPRSFEQPFQCDAESATIDEELADNELW
jgi:hypothetical protein